MWYVIQVRGGTERQVVDSIKRHMTEMGVDELVRECFSPEYETMIKFRGQWVKRKKAMLPGYVIVDTDDADGLSVALRKVPEFTRLLGSDDGFIPLTEAEMAWIDAITQGGTGSGANSRTVGISEGIMEGDKIIILNGPLMNHTGLITGINKRKRLAFLEIEMFGRTIKTKMGLNILAKRPE